MLRLIALALCAVWLAGCASKGPLGVDTRPPDAELLARWQARAAQLAPVDGFTVRGRVAASAIGFKADLLWRQRPDGRFDMRVAGPFGAGAARLSGNRDQVRVRSGNEEEEITTEPEAWLQQRLGVRLPVAGLRWWALGLPAPDSHFDLLLDPAGRAQRIVQDGWVLDYPDYRAVESMELPRRIEARNGDTRVIVLADAWSNLEPEP